MSETTETTAKLVLCPYCGHAQHGGERCQACAGVFEPLSRRATQLAMGPWQVRDKHNPFRPGCCYDVLKKMASAGKIKSTTVMRGPTTRQYWSIARNVPGVAHLIGYCHQCGNHVSPSDAKCGECGTAFTEPRERNLLGLTYKNDDEVRIGQQALDAEIRGEPAPQQQMPGPIKRAKLRPGKAGDLLSEVLDLSMDSNAPAPSPTPSRPGPGGTATVSQAPAKPIPFVSPPQKTMSPAPASAFDVEPTRPLPESGGISTLGLVMIALNIIAIASLVVVFVMLR